MDQPNVTGHFGSEVSSCTLSAIVELWLKVKKYAC